jgi:branched-chain amino acid transport system ATP-binding protein
MIGPLEGGLLEVGAVQAGYGAVEVLHGVTLAVPPGGVATVVGPNGAGKSTLLRAIMGFLPCTGTIRLDGRDLRGITPEARVALGISLVPEQRELFTTMTVEENLLLGGASRYRWGRGRALAAELERIFADFPRLLERRRQLAGTLSGGERQMLALGRALMARPRLLLLDEPSLGLAPRVVGEIFRLIARLRATGVAVLLVEQNARAALRTADYAYVLEGGSIVLEGPSAALAAEERVIDAYLGLSKAEMAAPQAEASRR